MRRSSNSGFGIAVVCMLALGLATGASSQPAGDQKRACNSIRLGEVRVFYKHGMKCSPAKDRARRVYRSNGENPPRNFTCESGSNFNEGGACEHDFKDKYFGWHPAD